jgi:hypothetical protein
LTSALLGGEWSASGPDRYTPGVRAPGIYSIVGCVSLRIGLDGVEKRVFLTLPGLELRPLGRPARSQSLYRLRYPGGNWIYWALIQLVTTPHKSVLQTNRCSQSRCLVTASNDGSCSAFGLTFLQADDHLIPTSLLTNRRLRTLKSH